MEQNLLALQIVVLGACLLSIGGCGREATAPPTPPAETQPAKAAPKVTIPRPWPSLAPRAPRTFKVVHVFVCLCDNANQGIVRVPNALGNGQDPKNNLYWGAMYGTKTFLSRSSHWRTVPAGGLTITRDETDAAAVLDRAVFESTGGPKTYILAEAYDGAHMALALRRFIAASAGTLQRTVAAASGADGITIQAGGKADLVCFVGHNGLMDAPLPIEPKPADERPAGAVVLACKSRDYFSGPLKAAKCPPLILTTGFMAPEAYTLEAVIRAWAAGRPADAIHLSAAEAYAKYQRCHLSAARRLFTKPAP